MSASDEALCQACGACCTYSADWPRFGLETEEEIEAIPRDYVDDARGTMRCNGDRCAVFQPANRFVGVAVESEHLRGVDVVGRHRGQPACVIEDGLRRDDRGGLGDTAVGDHQDPVGTLGVGHEPRLERNGYSHIAGRRIGQ